jgi:hypothetical protein
MEQFSKYFDSLQAAVLSTKVDDRVGLPCQCQRDVALFRCMDCSFSPILCSFCAVASHTSNPFHRLEKWTGSYFRRTTLCDLGHIIGLGHYGVLCPTRLPDSNGGPTTIVHVNGIHHVRIQYCQCADAPSELEQLAKSSLFPASIERPETAFTFNVLKEFHVLSSTSKIAAYDFFNALADMTNSTFPNDVTVSLLPLLSMFCCDRLCRIDIASSFALSAYGATLQRFDGVARHMALITFSAIANPTQLRSIALLARSPVSM